MSRSSLKNVMRLIDEVQEVLPPEQGFLQDLKRSIEMDEVKNKRKPSEMYKPSSMQCIRCMYYQRTGTEPDPSNPSYVLTGICNSGSDIHERIQTAVAGMRDNNIDCDYVDVGEYVKEQGLDLDIVAKSGMETKLRHNSLHLSFMCDGIIKYKGQHYLLELKTETANKWFSRSGVDTKHYDQGTAYATAFNINRVIFVYISRDTLDMKAYLFRVTDEMKQNLIGKITECDGYVERLIPPPKPEVDRRVCQYCNYAQTCRKDG